MFFNNTDHMIDALDDIESFLNNDTNSIEFKDEKSSKTHQKLKDKIISISRLIEQKQKEDLTIYGEIMLCAQKLSDGYTNDRVMKRTSNVKLNYIAKSINNMSEKLETNLDNIEERLSEYSEQNFSNIINEDMFRGGSLKRLSAGINYLKEEITKNLISTYRTSLVIQQESQTLLENSSSLSQATMTQATSLEETAAAIEQITVTTASNTNTANKMAKFGENVKQSIEHGMNLTNETVHAMNEINSSTKTVHEALEMIDQIAFQTNILSLNAAVEAATAGEAGKGFAVVAQEVRNLATRSADAAKQIKELVEIASVRANEGKEIADQMLDGYDVLNKNVDETTHLINEVVVASREQEKSISQINSSVTQIDTLTQQNASVAENVKMISDQMNKIANKNVAIVSQAQFEGKESLQTRDNSERVNYHGEDRRAKY